MKKDLFDPDHLAFLWQKQEEAQGEKAEEEEKPDQPEEEEPSLEEAVSSWCELLKQRLSPEEWEALLPHLEQLLEASYSEEKEDKARQILVLLEKVEDLLMYFVSERLQKK